MAEALATDDLSQPSELVRKSLYSASEVQLAMRLLLARRSNSKRVLNRTALSDADEMSYGYIPVTEDNILWALDVFEKMVFNSSWQVVFT